MRSPEEINLQKDRIHRSIDYSNPYIGHAGAYIIAASSVYSYGQATYYHYPCFYLIHHAVELLIKEKFKISQRGHYLVSLIEGSDVALSYFSKEEKELLRKSDELNQDDGQLRYYLEPHKVFEWEDTFDGLLNLAERLLIQKL